MTSDEIKKALECCSEHEACHNCPCKKECGDLSVVTTEALNYINQLEVEVESLEHLVNIKNIMINELNKACENIKSEAIKEFAERLKEKTISMSRFEGKKHYVNDFVDTKDIDNLVKEMVGEIS